MKKRSNPFDYNDGDFIFSSNENIGFDSDGHIMMRMSDTMAMDMEDGEIHFISFWPDDYDDDC